MSRIDEKTVVPLSVVATLFTMGITVTAIGVYWVTSVNDRLGRIEQALSIHPIPPPAFIIPRAEAHGND